MIKEMPEIAADAMQSIMPIMRKSIDKMTQQLQEKITAMLKDSDGK